MFLASYAFAGPPHELVERFHRVMEGFPTDDLLLNVIVTTDSGITVYDACPDRATFERFSSGEELAQALRDAGLPMPKVTPLGDVHGAVVRHPADEVHEAMA